LITGITGIIEVVGDFMELGGDVLWAICLVTFWMWAMILERQWYFHLVYPKDFAKALDAWNARADHVSWHALQIRRKLIGELSEKLNDSLTMIKTVVALCPLFGLLGTVSGMIEVFDVMALAGNGNPRAMASGVSMATIPTMAGMVAALSGLYFVHQLERYAYSQVRSASDRLAYE